jgi:hypothetical protein
MKKIIFSFLALCTFVCHSQDVLDKIADETCECVNKVKTPNTSVEDLKTQVDKCLFASYSNHAAELSPAQKKDSGNKIAIQKLANDVALKMAGHCSDIIQIIIESERKNKLANERSLATKSLLMKISGEIREIETNEFVSIIIKDQNSKLVTLLLMDRFESADVFTTNKIRKGDKITVEYTEKEMYDPKIKGFRAFKIISKLEKQ